jgi:hypothetical protein
MKKLLGIALSLASVTFAAGTAEAKAAESSISSAVTVNAAAPQWGTLGQRARRNNRGVRVVNRSRLVRVGRRVYRETYQIRYLPNGGTRTRLISRVRVR